MRGAFELRIPGKLTGRKVILVDDVFTTGATLTTAAKAIMKDKPAELRVLVVARRCPPFPDLGGYSVNAAVSALVPGLLIHRE